MIRDAIQAIVAGESLDRQTASAAMDDVMSGEATAAQIGGFLVALRIKGETVEEMVGLVQSMRNHATLINIDATAVDTCGTGGDGSGTFNISTAAALVARGAGAIVAKHGNRAASSQCGSADVFEALGVPITLAPQQVEQCAREAGIAFMFAPTFHPAMKHAGGPRKELGVRTVFNLLGPLANPGGVHRQALGVASADAAARMVQVLAALGHERALVFHGDDGLDELSTAGTSHVFDLHHGAITEYDVDPEQLGVAHADIGDLAGGDATANAAIIRDILGGQPGPHRDVVQLNAAAALVASGLAADLAAGLGLAGEAIDSGAAQKALARMVEVATALQG
jgi:anthranilate phosphoribosyltransferase